MASPLNIKTEGLFNMDLHHSPLDWSPASSSSSPTKIALPQAYFPQYTEVPVAKTVRDSRRLEEAPFTFEFSKIESIAQSPVVQKELGPPHTPSSPSGSGNISPSSSEIVERVPRPPNAFMLFRSHFLREEKIPKSVEKRQQALSRVAGEVWGLMSAEAKDVWHVEAAKKQREHKEKYPNYKFIPSPRGTRRNKDKVHTVNDTVATAQERTQQLREKYTNFLGPSPVSSRKRRPKKDRGIGASTNHFPSYHSLPNSPLSSPPSSPSKGMRAHKSPESLFYTGGQHRIPRRPSTSLGFNEHHPAQQPSGNGAGADVKRFPGGGFLDFVGARDQEMFANSQPFDVSSNWTMDHTMIGSSQHNPLHHQIAGPFPPSPANAPSSAFDMLNQMDGIEAQAKNLILGSGTVEGSNNQLCDPSFLGAMAFNQDFFSLPPFVDNAVTQPLDNQDSQNLFDPSKWPEFTNPFLPQANDTGFNFN